MILTPGRAKEIDGTCATRAPEYRGCALRHPNLHRANYRPPDSPITLGEPVRSRGEQEGLMVKAGFSISVDRLSGLPVSSGDRVAALDTGATANSGCFK